MTKTTATALSALLLALAAPAGRADADHPDRERAAGDVANAASAPKLRRCAKTDPANGISALQVRGVTCRAGLAVARRTNSVRCFLNGDRCRHRFRGRSWHCRLGGRPYGTKVRCTSGRRLVTYRGGD